MIKNLDDLSIMIFIWYDMNISKFKGLNILLEDSIKILFYEIIYVAATYIKIKSSLTHKL